MRLNRFGISFILVAILFGCTQCKPQPLPVLSGKITVADGWKRVVYLIEPRSFDEIAASYNGIVIDSAIIAPDGQFAFEKIPDSAHPRLYQLVMQPLESRYPNQLIDASPILANYMPLVLQPGIPIQCTAESAHFQASFNFKEASSHNQTLQTLRQIRHTSYQQLEAELEAAKTPDEHHLLEQEDILRQFQRPLMQFADTTASVWAALVATRWVSLQNDYERIPEFLHGQCQRWSALQTDNPFVEQLCARASSDKLPVLVNSTIPDFQLPMSTGDTTALYELKGKRLTLLDLWASWCAPCRRENRDILVPLWENQHQKGFQIIGYALDGSEKTWKRAIEKDGAFRWLHASHLQGDDAPLLEVLRIQTIPANFLLDEDGTIVAKNLHGEDLIQFVEEYMKE